METFRNWEGEARAQEILHRYLSHLSKLRAKDVHVIDFRGDYDSGMWSALCQLPDSTELYFLEQSLPTRKTNVMTYSIARDDQIED